MDAFIQQHRSAVTGVLTGFDRLVLRGQLPISYVGAMDKCLGVERILYKDFGDFAAEKTKVLVESTERFAEERGRPLVYLRSPKIDKEETARTIAAQDGVTSGLVCVLKSVEPCWRFDVRKNRETGRLGLVAEEGKCAFFYHYAFHPLFGWMNARIETYLPFTIQLCLNGREWLARRMDAAGIAYEKRENTFAWVQDLERAQTLLEEQTAIDWNTELDGIARCLLPSYPRVFSKFEIKYSWTVHESEVATDVMFGDDSTLRTIYGPLTRHAISTFRAEDVMRFLGQNRVTQRGELHKNFNGEVVSSYKRRPEGIRVKHFVGVNSIKMYDKADGRVLRVETTINRPTDFRILRPVEGKNPRILKRRKLRRSIDDIARRLQLCRDANARYLDKLGSFSCPETLRDITEPLTRVAQLKSSRVRALRPYASDDLALLEAVNRGEFTVNGFRNADIRRLLFTDPTDDTVRKRQASSVTRKIRLLRAHGIVERLPGSHRYQLTARGRNATTAVLLAVQADVKKLSAVA